MLLVTQTKMDDSCSFTFWAACGAPALRSPVWLWTIRAAGPQPEVSIVPDGGRYARARSITHNCPVHVPHTRQEPTARQHVIVSPSLAVYCTDSGGSGISHPGLPATRRAARSFKRLEAQRGMCTTGGTAEGGLTRCDKRPSSIFIIVGFSAMLWRGADRLGLS